MTHCALVVCALATLCRLCEGRVVVVATPVIFTNNNGGGADEMQAPAQNTASKMFNAGENVKAAWYQPYDNINDLSAIRQIDVQPRGNQVELVAGGYQRSGRVRVKIFAEVEG